MARLRRQRGLTQEDLASRVGCDRENIVRVEQQRGRWSEATARRVLEELSREGALAPEDARAFAAGAGLEASVADVILHRQQDLDPTGQVARARAHALLDEVIGQLGAERAISILGALAAPPEDPPRQITVRTPPVQKGTKSHPYVEESHVDYEVREEDQGSSEATG